VISSIYLSPSGQHIVRISAPVLTLPYQRASKGTSGSEWPGDGEIDIIENVHSSSSNQVAWHTLPGTPFLPSPCSSPYSLLGCTLTTPGNFTGTAGAVTCDATINYNTGCGIVDQSIASFGETFNEKGGGVYAMKWDQLSIDVCAYIALLVRDNLEAKNPGRVLLPISHSG
jgi:hypothetical protein